MERLTEILSVLTLASTVGGFFLLALRLGRYSQASEDKATALTSELARCRAECDRRMQTLKEDGTAYSHGALRDLRAEIDRRLQQQEHVFARKDVVDTQYKALADLITNEFRNVKSRLARLDGEPEESES